MVAIKPLSAQDRFCGLCDSHASDFGFADGVDKGHETVKELGAPPMTFGAVVGLDLEGGDLLTLGQRQTVPPGFEAVDDEIAGFRRGAEIQAHLPAVLLQEAKGRVSFLAAHVMIGGTALPTGEPTA